MKKFLFIIAISSCLLADSFTPSHYCTKPTKPYKPYSFSSQWELDSYKSNMESFYNNVERYKNCIEDFVEEQNDAVRKHNNAAQEAIDEWNSFVNYELKLRVYNEISNSNRNYSIFILVQTI